MCVIFVWGGGTRFCDCPPLQLLGGRFLESSFAKKECCEAFG